MSDLKLFNLKNNNLLSPQKLLTLKLQELVESMAKDLLGLTIIANNYLINEGTNEIIQTLGLDENYTLVVVEYRSGKFGSLINKGLVYIDYIKYNVSKIKMLINDKLGTEVTKQVNFNSRLIIIGDDFNKYDEYSIKQINIQIDLIKYQLFDKTHILFEKNYHSKSVDHQQLTYKFTNRDQIALYKLISDYVLSLGDEVVETGFNNYLCYRKIKNFMFLVFNDNIEISIMVNNKNKTFIIKNEKDFEKAQASIELAYDQN